MKVITPALLLVAACGFTRPRPIAPDSADAQLHHRALARDVSIGDDDALDLLRRSVIDMRH